MGRISPKTGKPLQGQHMEEPDKELRHEPDISISANIYDEPWRIPNDPRVS